MRGCRNDIANTVYPLFGAEGPFLLHDGSIQTDHPRHPLHKTLIILHPTAIHTITKNPKQAENEIFDEQEVTFFFFFLISIV